MKYCLTLLATMLLLNLSSFSQTKDETAIRTTLQKQSDAWNKGNIEQFMKGYWENDSLVFIGKKGLTYGWQNTLNNYKKSYPDTIAMGKLQFTILFIKRLSDQYQEVIGKWHLSRKDGDLEGHFTLLFEKINGVWVIIMDHSS